jgi:hypothetical protein
VYTAKRDIGAIVSVDYHVLIDGQKATAISEGQSIDLPVRAGNHRVKMVVDWIFSSRELQVCAEAGSAYGTVRRSDLGRARES